MRITPGWSSHMYVLSKALYMTKGPVLEMGMGLFSTPLMHWICEDSKRELVSFENDPNYYKWFKHFGNESHKVYLIEDWAKADIDKPWEIALIDHKPEERRLIDIKRLASWAKYLIVHDSEPEVAMLYHYDQIFPMFKYRLDYTKAMPYTTVLSNFQEIKL